MKAFLLKDTKYYGLLVLFVAFYASLFVVFFAGYRYKVALEEYKLVVRSYVSSSINVKTNK